MSDLQTVIWAFVIVFALAMVGFTIVGGLAFYRASAGQAKSFGLLFERSNFLRLATAVLIIFATVLLAALNKLSSEAVAAILSGVAGYVLGGMDRSVKESSTTGPKVNE
jgi:hypothetical protein